MPRENMFISDIILKLLLNKHISPREKRQIIEEIVILYDRIITNACLIAQEQGNLRPISRDLRRAAIKELNDYIEPIDFHTINEKIEKCSEWLETEYTYDSAWKASILIISLLECKKVSHRLDKQIDWLTDPRNMTPEGLWHSPWDSRPNIFDTSSAVVALIEAGVSKDNEVIVRAINFR